MSRPATWIAGLAGSAMIHAAGFGLYMATRSVDAPPEQSTLESKLQLDTVEAKTQDAQAQTPEADNADTAEADSTALDAGAIRQSTAQALATPQDTASVILPDSTTLPTAPDAADQIAAAVPVTDTAQPAQADSATLTATTPNLPNATVGDLDQSPAIAAATLESDVLPSIASPTTTTQASAVVAASSPSQTTGATTVTPALSAPTVVASASALPSVSAKTHVPDIARVGSATPTALPVTQSTPNSATAQQSDAQGTTAPSSDTNAATAEQPPLPADTAKANLAWQFGDRLVTDPQALATIQAFMTPNTVDGGAEVKDGLSDVLTRIDCARLSATFIPETGTLEMRGHIPDPSLRGSILSAMQAQVGDGIPVTTNLLHLPSPQCGALTGIADVGLPQSTDQFTNKRLVGANTHAAEFPYTEGNKFQFEFTAPEYDAVVYVDYFDADGKVVHLQPNLTGIDGIQKANSVVGVYPKQPGTNDPIVIGPPFGQEIAVAFAASEPLFDTPRPIIEDAEPYLEWLKERVADARARNPDFKGEWVYFFITTKPASQ